MGRGSWETPPPGKEIPDDSAEQAGKHDILGNDVELDHSLANGFGDSCSEQERGNEIEERCPKDRHFGRENARGDDGGNTVGRVVETIDEVECQGDEDGEDKKYETTVH